MEETRQTLLDVGDAANKMSQKLEPQAAGSPAAPRQQSVKRQ